MAREVDIADMAARRYRLGPFVDLLRAADFDVLFANYFTGFGPPIILAQKAVKALLPKRLGVDQPPDMRPLPPLVNAAFYGLARMEAAIVRASVPMPFGTTIVCVARPRGAARH